MMCLSMFKWTMDLKALSPLLDPVLGQNMELGLCVERMEVREMLLLGPSSFSLTIFSYLLALRHCELRGVSPRDPKQGQEVGLTL
jgi:hypothetical protein